MTATTAATPASTKDENNNNNSNQITIVLPGDDVTSHITKIQNRSSSSQKKNKKPIKIGKGLQVVSPATTNGNDNLSSSSSKSSTPQIKCTIAGRLQYNTSSNTFYILTNTKRYTPQIHDRVIGIIEDRMGDYYRVTIPGCTLGNNLIHHALLCCVGVMAGLSGS